LIKNPKKKKINKGKDLELKKLTLAYIVLAQKHINFRKKEKKEKITSRAFFFFLDVVLKINIHIYKKKSEFAYPEWSKRLHFHGLQSHGLGK
jgi:hypothetical protein